MRILGISGSFRRDSHNTRLLRAAALALPPGVELERFDGLAAVPPYCEDADADPAPDAVARLREQIAGADALLIATPEYNGSIPGVLKNAIDWASRPFPDNALRGKPVAVIGASTGLFGAVWAQAELRKVLQHTGADVLEQELPVGLADEAFTPTGELADAELQRRIVELLERLGAGNVHRIDGRVQHRDRSPAVRAV
jgi:chromate reductase